MSDWRWTWWMVVAVVIGVGELVLGIGNVVSFLTDDRRDFVSAFVAFLTATGAAALVFGGMAIRRTNRPRGGAMVAVGMFPGCLAIVFFWFPPAVAVGLVSIVATAFAIVDATGSRQELSEA
jgi:TctA family transporter